MATDINAAEGGRRSRFLGACQAEVQADVWEWREIHKAYVPLIDRGRDHDLSTADGLRESSALKGKT